MTIYKFKSKVTGDLIMLAPHGNQVMTILGREPAALAALQAAIDAEAAAAAETGESGATEEDGGGARAVALRQRLWPMMEMLRRAVTATRGEPSPLPPLDPHDCRFGHWLDSIGRTRYGHYPSFDKLVDSHRAVHETGRQIEALAHHDRASARTGLGSLDQRRDTLLLALNELRDEVLSSAS